MSEHPTEPGFYWASLSDGWQPVQLVISSDRDWDVWAIGSDRCYRRDVLEWGPRIEREPDPPTREQVEEAIESMSGINSVIRGKLPHG